LDEVLGEAELIVGAEYGVISAKVSPDGRWLMAKLNKAQAKQALLVDLEKREFYRLDMQVTWIQWLDNDHVFIGSILRIPDLVWWHLEFRDPDPGSLDALVNADPIFAIERGASSRLITTDPDSPYFVSVNWDGKELEANLADVSYTIIRDDIVMYCPQDVIVAYLDRCRRYDSPDGHYYIKEAKHPDERYRHHAAQEVIFDAQTGERVAHMYKWEWWLGSLGWAGDSSGAYFEVVAEGEYLNQTLEAHPIYKLLVPGATLGPPLKEVPLPPGSGLLEP
jgi:hypothetical protein